MWGSFRLIKLFGIPVKLHWTFGFLLLWIGYTTYSYGAGWAEVAWHLLFVMALFVCVVLHEFGHALTARRFGVNTRDIILSPIGGVARLDRLPEKPMQEFLVAVAGPAVNIIIAIVLSPYFLIVPEYRFAERLADGTLLTNGLGFIPALILLNLVLATFNLLPAFPMDGGRILRSLLSIKLGRIKATRVAALIGQAFAVLLVVYAFWSDSWLTIFIGIFIFFMANQEYQSVRINALLSQHSVKAVLRSDFSRLYLSEKMDQAARLLRQGLEKNFLVFDEYYKLAGTLGEGKIISAIKEHKLDTSIAENLTPEPPTIHLDDPIRKAYEILYSSKHQILPIESHGTLVGVVDVEGLKNFLERQKKLA